MPRRIDHVDGVIVAVGIQVLRPGVGGGTGIGILRQEAGGGGVVVPRVHVEQAGGVRNAPRERHLVEERIAIARAGRHAELVVVVRLDDGTCPIHNVRDAPADVVPVEEVVVRIRALPGGCLPLEPLARHDRPRRVEDVLRLQHVLVHRREQQRRARVVEVRNDLVLHPRHALTPRVIRIRRLCQCLLFFYILRKNLFARFNFSDEHLFLFASFFFEYFSTAFLNESSA